MHINVESLCCIPETNTVCQLYFNNFLKINTRDKKGVGGWQSGQYYVSKYYIPFSAKPKQIKKYYSQIS